MKSIVGAKMRDAVFWKDKCYGIRLGRWVNLSKGQGVKTTWGIWGP